jgi:hypothetical protein
MPSAAALLLAIAGLLSVPACLAARASPADIEAAGWRLWFLDGVPPTRFEIREPGRIDVSAERSFGLLYRPVEEGDGSKPLLQWRWRVDRAIAATDLSARGSDDRALAVHVWFPDPDSTFLRRAAHWFLRSLAGAPPTGKVLTYVWGGSGRRGEMLANPHFPEDGVLVLLQPGTPPTGQWLMENVDLARDFQRWFGRPMPQAAFIAISGDTEDTGSASAGAVADLAFGSR